MTEPPLKEEQDRPTKSLLGAIAFFVLLAVLVTPENLIALGPLKQSLTSKYPSVRDVTYMEVKLLRLSCLVFALFLGAISLGWKRLVNSAFVASINADEPFETQRHAAFDRYLNGSFLVIAVCYVLSLVTLVFAPERVGYDRYLFFLREDGMTETVSALLLLLCSIASIVLAYRFTGTRSRRIMHCVIAFVFFVMMGEEISWGQRIFGFETLAFIKDVNIQNENNLHNLYGYFADHLFTFAIFAYGVFLPFIAHRKPFFRKLLDRFGLPLPTKGLTIGFLLISLLHQGLVYRIFTPPAHPLISLQCPEWREFLSTIAFSLLMYETWLLVPKRTPRAKQ
jgi:hypothetical protein